MLVFHSIVRLFLSTEKKEVSLDEVEMASSALSMTDLQAAAVVRRVTRLNATVKRWKAQTQFAHSGETEK